MEKRYWYVEKWCIKWMWVRHCQVGKYSASVDSGSPPAVFTGGQIAEYGERAASECMVPRFKSAQ